MGNVGNMLRFVGNTLGIFGTDLIADKAMCDLNRKVFTMCYKMSSLSQLSKIRTFVGVG